MRENPEGDPALSVPSVALSGAVLRFFSWQVRPTPQLYTQTKLSRILFSAFLELFQIFKKQNVCEPNFATPNFFHFFGGKIGKGVQIFEPVGKKLLGRHALGGDFGGLFLYLGFLGFFGFEFGDLVQKKQTRKTWGTNEKGRKKIAYRGLILSYHRGKGPLGGTLANFFHRIFGVVPDFQETKRL